MNMEKMKWTRPEVTGEMFEANEYVAACITGTIQCMYPGTSPTDQDDGTKTYEDQYGMWHGICGNDAPISFNGDTASGFEVVNGQVDRTRPICKISGYEQKVGTYRSVTWDSTDGNATYHHKGRLIITNLDNAHPNHS